MNRPAPSAFEASITGLLAGPKFADKPFLSTGETFGQVYSLAARLLNGLGREKNRTAPVCLATENKAILAAALLASLAGGPVFLLPFALSSPALSGIRQATGSTTLLTDASHDFPPEIEVIRPSLSGSDPGMDLSPASPGAELLRIFSGGSTGSPNIWSKTGKNIFTEALFLSQHFGISASDCLVATISPLHIYGLLFSVALPLVSSATVLAETPSFPGEIITAARHNGATVLAGVPAHYRALRGKTIPASSLRLAFSSAGMLDATDSLDFSRHNRVGVVEVYGSTETGGIASRNRNQGEEHFTPFPVVDWTISGESLRVRSPFLSPTLPCDPDGAFTVGDRVKAYGSGGFILKGRTDSITKVGGKRVDLEEIRALINGEPEVVDSAVLSLAETGGRENRIVALVAGGLIDTDAIKKRLAAVLEPYALPRQIKTVSQLPLKANGKHDRAAMLRFFDL